MSTNMEGRSRPRPARRPAPVVPGTPPEPSLKVVPTSDTIPVPAFPPVPEPPPVSALQPLANTGYCVNGHMVWSGGPPSEGEFPLTCRYCEVLVERPA